MACNIRCRTAKTPVEKCQCSCGGDNHGQTATLSEFASEPIESDNVGGNTEELECEVCGKPQTREEYWAVGISTPAALVLRIRDRSKDHHVVCEDCYIRACEMINRGEARGLL